MTISVNPPYLLFLADAEDRIAAKTAVGIFHWRREQCVGQLRLPGCKLDLGLPDFTAANAAASGARTLVIGLAPAGGQLPDSWVETLDQALRAGLDLASGLHVRVAAIPQLARTAAAHGRTIHDVRFPTVEFPPGSVRKRSGKRLLAVGTDCAVGKMFTALAIEREMHARGWAADFRATGQTGIFIAGTGVSIDAVVSDFISGAAESLSPDNAPDHWDLVEGQGSLFHPSYAGVSLGLLHGSQPDALVLCHEAGREFNGDFLDFRLPTLAACAEMNLALARIVNPQVSLVGLSINTSRLSADAAGTLLTSLSREMGVPAVDPVRTGVKPIVDVLEALPSRG